MLTIGTFGNNHKGINVLGATGSYVRKIIRRYSADHNLVTVTFYHKPHFYFIGLIRPQGTQKQSLWCSR